MSEIEMESEAVAVDQGHLHWVYHPSQPAEVVDTGEYLRRLDSGWYDSPAKFPAADAKKKIVAAKAQSNSHYIEDEAEKLRDELQEILEPVITELADKVEADLEDEKEDSKSVKKRKKAQKDE